MVGFSIGTGNTRFHHSSVLANGVVGCVRPMDESADTRNGLELDHGQSGSHVPHCRRLRHGFRANPGTDPLDLTSVDAPSGFPLNPRSRARRSASFVKNSIRVNDPEVSMIFRNALRVLESQGAILEEIDSRNIRTDIARFTMNVEAACVFEPLWKSGRIEMLINKQRATDFNRSTLLPRWTI